MPAHYTVVQFVPNPIADERVNIGVIVYNQRDVRVRFLSRWDRVKNFARQDVHFLRDIAQETVRRIDGFVSAVRSGLEPSFPGAFIENMIARGQHCVQLTQLRASTKDPSEVIDALCQQFLNEPIPEPRAVRDRAAASRAAVSGLRNALEETIGDLAEDYLKKKEKVVGKHQAHRFDAVVANGVPYMAVSGISFEGEHSGRLEMALDSLAWSVSDIVARSQGIKVGILALPPRHSNPDYASQIDYFGEKQRLYTDLGADFMTEAEYPGWAKRTVAALPFPRR
jgi:Protein of unknown function (DUF3037)